VIRGESPRLANRDHPALGGGHLLGRPPEELPPVRRRVLLLVDVVARLTAVVVPRVSAVAVAARRISQRTRDALTAYKADRRVSKRVRALHPDSVPPEVIEATAGKLGASLPQCRNLTDTARQKGSQAAAASRKRQARDAYAHLISTMLEFQAAGRSLAQIADDLNDQGHKTRRERRWSKTQVKRVLDRVRPA
jgi:hypothetical protein